MLMESHPLWSFQLCVSFIFKCQLPVRQRLKHVSSLPLRLLQFWILQRTPTDTDTDTDTDVLLYIIKVFTVHIFDLHKHLYPFQGKILIILYVTTVHANVTEFYSLTIAFLMKASRVNLKVLQYHLQLNIEQFMVPCLQRV